MDKQTENNNQEENQPEVSQTEEKTPLEETEEQTVPENKFQQLLDEYEYDRPKRGQVLDGEILWIDEDSIMVDIGQKRDGIIPIKDLSNVDDDYLESLSVGDKIPVYVTRTPVGDEDLVVSLDRGLEHETWDQAEQDMEESKLLNLEVIGQNRGGLLVRYDTLQGFVPNSHIPSLYRSKNRQEAGQLKQEMIGETLPVKVIEVNRQKQRLVFSARAAQKEQRKKRLEELEEGEIIHGEVVNIVDFGIFVDLNGVDGLVHKSKLAWKRVRHPSNLFKVGDEVEVKVIDVDVDRERVSLSRKAMLPNPWQELEEKYQPGDLVKGKITRVLDFGAFVELPEGVQGLIHTSEIGYSASHSAKDIVKPGETVLVRIINIDAERERISLSMRRVPVEQQLNWMIEGRREEGDATEETKAELEGEIDAEPAMEEQAEIEEAEIETAETAELGEDPVQAEVEVAEAEEAVGEEEAIEDTTQAEAEEVAEVSTDLDVEEPEDVGEDEVAEEGTQAETEEAAQTSAELDAEGPDEDEPEEVGEAEVEAKAEETTEPSAELDAGEEETEEKDSEVETETGGEQEEDPGDGEQEEKS